MQENAESYAMSTPPWKRYTLTVTEASDYYHIGNKKLYRLAAEHPNADFIVMVGNKILLKRRQFEEFLDDSTCL